MSQRPIPVQLFERGYTPLVSVIPPNAQLSPGSAIQPDQRGKSPGRRNSNGTWGGYGWLKYPTTIDDAQQWASDGANIGLKAEQFPALDIDSLDPFISTEVAALAQRVLGPAPVRVGKAPKQLLMYRLEGDPFARMAVQIRRGPDDVQLVEFLGAGRQYLIYGVHPSGKNYEWDRELPAPASLTPVSREKVAAFFDELTDLMEMIPGTEVVRLGDGRVRGAADDQSGLKAPSLEMLAECVALIPNDRDTAPDWDAYLKIAYAIRAAGGEHEEEAYQVFLEWCSRWVGREGKTFDPETVRSDWRRLAPPFSVGWGWLAEIGRQFGFDDSTDDFVPIGDGRQLNADGSITTSSLAAELSDQWAADAVIAEHGDTIRFVNSEGYWYVWSEGRWSRNTTALAEHKIGQTLARLADKVLKQGATAAEKKEALTQGRRLCSAYTLASVRKIVETDPRIAMRPEAFDADPWLLNTPGGLVDLRTGNMAQHQSSMLCTKQTAATPNTAAGCPEWIRFLGEATGGDASLVDYLQRVFGYALTGSADEQCLFFIWGPGENGKSVFLNVLQGVLGDYARTAPMETFTATSGDKHPTELAMLMGARMVAANETQAGKRWDEAKLKSLTGGDRISARFMHRDFFTYKPQFKLVFVGNHKPEIRDLDKAMRRRVQMIPFTVSPKVKDVKLPEKLEAEWPAILAWAIDGCRLWQATGLAVPKVVSEATEEYFGEQDSIQRFLDEKVVIEEGAKASTQALYDSWREWATSAGEFVGTEKRFSQAMISKKFGRYRDAKTRGFTGLKLIDPFMGGMG